MIDIASIGQERWESAEWELTDESATKYRVQQCTVHSEKHRNGESKDTTR